MVHLFPGGAWQSLPRPVWWWLCGLWSAHRHGLLRGGAEVWEKAGVRFKSLFSFSQNGYEMMSTTILIDQCSDRSRRKFENQTETGTKVHHRHVTKERDRR